MTKETDDMILFAWKTVPKKSRLRYSHYYWMRDSEVASSIDLLESEYWLNSWVGDSIGKFQKSGGLLLLSE